MTDVVTVEAPVEEMGTLVEIPTVKPFRSSYGTFLPTLEKREAPALTTMKKIVVYYNRDNPRAGRYYGFLIKHCLSLFDMDAEIHSFSRHSDIIDTAACVGKAIIFAGITLPTQTLHAVLNKAAAVLCIDMRLAEREDIKNFPCSSSTMSWEAFVVASKASRPHTNLFYHELSKTVFSHPEEIAHFFGWTAPEWDSVVLSWLFVWNEVPKIVARQEKSDTSNPDTDVRSAAYTAVYLGSAYRSFTTGLLDPKTHERGPSNAASYEQYLRARMEIIRDITVYPSIEDVFRIGPYRSVCVVNAPNTVAQECARLLALRFSAGNGSAGIGMAYSESIHGRLFHVYTTPQSGISAGQLAELLFPGNGTGTDLEATFLAPRNWLGPHKG